MELGGYVYGSAMSWLLYLLVFIFGYVTCQTFYFFRSARTALILLRACHLIYLSSIMKAVENMYYARGVVLEHMLRTEKNSAEISTFEMRHEEEIKMLKDRSVDILIDLHPPFFNRLIEFENWEEASNYLEKYRTVVLKFWEK